MRHFYILLLCLWSPALFSQIILKDAKNPKKLILNPTLEEIGKKLLIPYTGDLQNFLEKTQKEWRRKTENSLDNKKNFEDKKQELMPLFQTLHLIEAEPLHVQKAQLAEEAKDNALAHHEKINYCLVAGSYFPGILDRLHYLIEVSKKQHISCAHLVFLTGDRDLDVNYESLQTLKELANKFSFYSPNLKTIEEEYKTLKNEYDLGVFLKKYTTLPPEMGNPKIIHINSPKKLKVNTAKNDEKTFTRPTTSDTLRDFLKITPTPTGSIVLATSQPFKEYMEVLALRIFSDHPALSLRVIASKPYYFDKIVNVALILDYLTRTLYAYLTVDETKL